MKINFEMNFSKLKLFGTVCALAVLCFSSCRKKGDNEKLDGKNQTAADLIPADSGSWWLMKANDNSVSVTTATGRDTFLAGNTYDYFEMKDTSNGHIAPYFYAKNGGYYLSLIDLTGDGEEFIPAIICTVSPKAGDEWLNTSQIHYSGIAVDVKTKGEVISTGGSLTLNGHTYQNVIQTKNELKAKPNSTPAWLNCGTLTMYFSPGIGVLKSDLDVSVIGLFQTHIANQLLDYHIED